MIEIEREFTFLVNNLPADLDEFPSKIVEDNYIPASSKHPILRLRRNDEKYMITKKCPVDSTDGGETGDSSRQIEQTIPLTKVEFDFINNLDGKRVKKRRFNYRGAEIDVFLGELSGLILADFEFADEKEMEKFAKPDWCGADVTQERLIAGGILAGKSYADISAELSEKYNYKAVKNIEKYEEAK